MQNTHQNNQFNDNESDTQNQIIDIKKEEKKDKLVNWKEIKQFFVDAKHFMTAATPEEAKYQHNIETELQQQIRPAVVFGAVVILLTIGFFVIWSGLAPLDSAAIAEGFVALSGSHKTIQHLEGGSIKEILVEEGDVVEEGQPLIILNSSHAKAAVQTLLSQLRLFKSIEKRLIAEERGDETVDFTDNILDLTNQEVQTFVRNQNGLFVLGRKALNLQIDVLNQRIIQKKEEIKGLDGKLKAETVKLQAAKERLETMQKLFEQGLELKPNITAKKNEIQDLEANVNGISTSIASANEQIAENELHKVNVENDFKHKVAERYKENRAAVLEFEQKLQAAQDVLDRTVIKAPKSGIITGLQYHTIGGVIQPGGKVMDIVPQDDKLIIQATIRAQDIESIYVGLEAKIQLNAYKSRLVPRISGEVIHVSADRFTDERSGMGFYMAKIEIKDEELKNLTSDVKLYPGMPVTVFIVKGTRTFLQYLLSPIIDSFHKAFKEA